METKELDLVKVQSDVVKATQLQIKAEDLQEMVNISAKITVPDLSNKEQVALAKESRLKLRKVEITIEKEAKAFRDIFTAVNNSIRVDEKKLLAITNPEIERLEAIEEEAKKIEIRNQRLALLPKHKEQLATIGDTVTITDEEILAMDIDAFTIYFNGRVTAKNEADRLALEAQQAKLREEQEAMEREKATQEREKIAREEAQAEAERKLKLAQEEADLRVQKEKEDAERRIKEEKERMEREAKEKAENEAKEKAEAERKEKEEQALLEKRKAYKDWLSTNGYVEEEKTNYHFTDNGIEIKMYKLVSTFKK